MGCVVQFAEELCWKRRDEDCFASSPERTSVLHSGWEGEREGGREGFDFTSVVPSQRLVEDLEYYELAHKAAGKLPTLTYLPSLSTWLLSLSPWLPSLSSWWRVCPL